MKIIQSILTNNPCYTAGEKITVKGLMLHSVGCPQPSASVFVRNWNKTTFKSACVHAFIDGNSGDVYQTLPWNHRGWHGGGSSNDTHIGVEMCEPACIKYTGGSSFTCSDTATAKAVVQRTYDTAVLLFAHLCKTYGLDPLADGVIVSHREGHKRGIASNHSDPEHIWNQLNMGYTMDTFRKAVKSRMDADSVANTNIPTNTEKGLYRVQVGAYANKSNADNMVAKLKAAGFDAIIVADKNAVEEAPKPTPKPEITFKAGDTVKMSTDATVYGKTTRFASWVYKSTLYVRQVNGSRIVVSTNKTGVVTGAVDKKYLTKI